MPVSLHSLVLNSAQNSPDISLSGGNCNPNLVLAPGALCQAAVTATPNANTLGNATTLTVTSADGTQASGAITTAGPQLVINGSQNIGMPYEQGAVLPVSINNAPGSFNWLNPMAAVSGITGVTPSLASSCTGLVQNQSCILTLTNSQSLGINDQGQVSLSGDNVSTPIAQNLYTQGIVFLPQASRTHLGVMKATVINDDTGLPYTLVFKFSDNIVVTGQLSFLTSAPDTGGNPLCQDLANNQLPNGQSCDIWVKATKGRTVGTQTGTLTLQATPPANSGAVSVSKTLNLSLETDLYAAGAFMVNGLPTTLAKWNGTSWSLIAQAPAANNGPINALSLTADGDLYIGGGFTQPVYYLALWNGTNFLPVGNSFVNGPVIALSSAPNGLLYVAGGNNGAIPYVAEWDGSNWSQLSNPFFAGTSDRIQTLFSDSLGNLYVGGISFSTGNNLAKWDGNTWSSLGNLPFTGGVTNSLAMDSNGILYAGGSFTSPIPKLAQWNGNIWSPVGTPPFNRSEASVYSLVTDSTNNLYIGGSDLGSVGNIGAHWNGSSWSTLGDPNWNYFQNFANSLMVDGNNNIYAGGSIRELSTAVVMYNSSTHSWSALGGTGGITPNVFAIILSTNLSLSQP